MSPVREWAVRHRASLLSGLLAGVALGLCAGLVMVFAQRDWTVQWLLLLPLAAGVVAPRPAVALTAGVVAVALFLVGVWVQGPHSECHADSPENGAASLGPAMQGCFDQPELNVSLWGVAAAIAWTALAVGVLAGSLWRARRA